MRVGLLFVGSLLVEVVGGESGSGFGLESDSVGKLVVVSGSTIDSSVDSDCSSFILEDRCFSIVARAKDSASSKVWL